MIYITKKVNQEKLMKHNPSMIGMVLGIRFYEHPILGDESPLIAVTKDYCGVTEFYELPTREDIEQASA